MEHSAKISDERHVPWHRHDRAAAEMLARPDPEALLRTIVANVPVIVFAIDRKGVISLCEGEGLQRLGKEPRQLVGRGVLDVFGDVPGIEEFLFRAFGGRSGSARLEVDDIVLEVWHSPLCSQEGEVVAVAGVALDVTEHERTDERLRAGQRLMEQMLQSHERDHRLIAYEIHDGLVQDAAAAQMQLGALLENPLLPDVIRDQLQLAADLVQQSISQARELIGGLRPPILDEHGVVAAIRYLAESRQTDGPSIRFTADVQFNRLEPLLETTIYRIVQEAVANIRRHSRSERAEIRLRQVGKRLHVEIEDWGVGFDPENVVTKVRFGLQGIRERARLLRGRAVINSAPGKGTRILVDLPVVPALEKLANTRSWSAE